MVAAAMTPILAAALAVLGAALATVGPERGQLPVRGLELPGDSVPRPMLSTDGDGTLDTPRATYTATLDDDACVLTSATDENGSTTSYTYDDVGRVLSVTPPVGDATTFTNDVPGRTATATTGTSVATHSYDALGRLSRSQSPNGTGAYSYLDVAQDELGRVATAYLPHAGTAGGLV